MSLENYLPATQNYSSKLLHCEQTNVCCLLTPISYEFNVFSQYQVPIYGCKKIEQFGKSQSENTEDSSTITRKLPDLDYAAYNFPQEIWIVKEPWEIAWKTSLVIPIVVIAILGNLTVIKIVVTKKAMRKNPFNLFIFNMSIADLLCSLLFPWIFLVSDFYQVFVLGAFICKLEGFILVTLMLTSVFTITVISIDRLVSIVFPFSFRLRPKSAKWIIIVIWIIACAISSPLFIYRVYKERQWKDFYEKWCTEDIQKLRAYWLVLMVVIVWVPVTCVTISYTTIIFKLDRLGKCKHNQPISQIKHKSKVIRMLFLVVVAFSICWIPFTAMILIRNTFPDREEVEITDWFRALFFVSHCLMYLNSAINPIIYGLMNDNFKKEIRSQGLLPSCFRKVETVEVSTVLPNEPTNPERTTKVQKVVAKYGVILPTNSSSIPSLSAFDRRNSALLDLGLPLPELKNLGNQQTIAQN